MLRQLVVKLVNNGQVVEVDNVYQLSLKINDTVIIREFQGVTLTSHEWSFYGLNTDNVPQNDCTTRTMADSSVISICTFFHKAVIIKL